MITCRTCGKVNEDHYKFCLGCGANLEAQREAAEVAVKFCPSCGAETTPGQRFCGSCGYNLASAPAEVPAAAVASPAAAPKAAKNSKPAAGPRAASAISLVMVKPDGSPGDIVDLFEGVNEVGRACGEPVFERDPYLSPAHARLTVTGASVQIEDLGSLNGVYYRITEITELQHGDCVRVGHELLRFYLIDQSEPVVAPATDGTVVAGSSPLGAWGRLERVSSPTEASLTFMLRGPETHLGRERGDILFRDDGYVSGKHARIFQDSGRYFVEDLKSSNGTFVRIRGQKTVGAGALLLLGQQPFRVHAK